jgi:hypothetical protein
MGQLTFCKLLFFLIIFVIFGYDDNQDGDICCRYLKKAIFTSSYRENLMLCVAVDTIESPLAPQSVLSVPLMNLKRLCHVLVNQPKVSDLRKVAQHSDLETWVYQSFYDTKPIGILCSPTKSVVFYIPLSSYGSIAWEKACYLSTSYENVMSYVRSGNSVMTSHLGPMTAVDSPSLVLWLKRNVRVPHTIK